MAEPPDNADNASWPRAEELFERGDPAFVPMIRRVTDADRLGNFAARWYADPRPTARQLLFDYLDQPLNAYRHEALVKRLFKLAERAGDDELMGRFLVAFDRCIRRRKKQRRFTFSKTVETEAAAVALADQWRRAGFESYHWQSFVWDGQQRRSVPRGYCVFRSWTGEGLWMPGGTTMPRKALRTWLGRNPRTGDRLQIEQATGTRERLRLFSAATRHYLRRRAWRYFRKLGKQQPERYLRAMAAALKCYRDEDTADGVALLDNWGLVHALFHHSPVLVAKPRGWNLAPGRGLSELAPAPIYGLLWKESPRRLLELLREARCRPVRQWAVHMIRRDHAGILKDLSPDELFALLAHEDATVVELAAEVVRNLPDLGVLGLDRLLGLLEAPHPDALPIRCELLETRLGVDRVTFDQAVRLARSRPLPAARLGFAWLKAKRPATEDECRALLGLAEARAEPLRPEMARSARAILSESPHFRPEWVLDFLDSRYAEVRAEGWAWMQADERARNDVGVWQKLLESPYDEVRMLLVVELEKRVASGADPDRDRPLDAALLHFVWAAVLLNVHRGGRVKPLAVGQLVRRMARRPAEAPSLMPALAVAVRSLRGPEWRAGLAGVVGLVERHPELRTLVQQSFPELKWQ